MTILQSAFTASCATWDTSLPSRLNMLQLRYDQNKFLRTTFRSGAINISSGIENVPTLTMSTGVPGHSDCLSKWSLMIKCFPSLLPLSLGSHFLNSGPRLSMSETVPDWVFLPTKWPKLMLVLGCDISYWIKSFSDNALDLQLKWR